MTDVQRGKTWLVVVSRLELGVQRKLSQTVHSVLHWRGGGIVHTVYVLCEWVTEIGGRIRLKRLGGLIGQEAIATAVDL